MVQGIVIPRDRTKPPWLQELAGISDFQNIVGGLVEPVEVEGFGATIWMNEATVHEHGQFNARATALWWYFSPEHTMRHFILGDVVIVGAIDKHGGGEAPAHLVHGLLHPHRYVVQMSPNDDAWGDTYASFDTIFEAAERCMLLCFAAGNGPGFRIHVDAVSDAACGAEGALHPR